MNNVTPARVRCPWAKSDPLYLSYHDQEWGVPTHDDQTLFEMLILEGAQAGLSWITVLRKRNNYRKAFSNFNPRQVAQYNTTKLEHLLDNKGIIRNRLKIKSSITNARAFLLIQSEFGTFNRYIWGFVDGHPTTNTWSRMEDIPTHTEQSDRMSNDLKRRGFSFVGSTICYAFMQATGMVNDHLVRCFRYKMVKQLR